MPLFGKSAGVTFVFVSRVAVRVFFLSCDGPRGPGEWRAAWLPVSITCWLGSQRPLPRLALGLEGNAQRRSLLPPPTSLPPSHPQRVKDKNSPGAFWAVGMKDPFKFKSLFPPNMGDKMKKKKKRSPDSLLAFYSSSTFIFQELFQGPDIWETQNSLKKKNDEKPLGSRPRA